MINRLEKRIAELYIERDMAGQCKDYVGALLAYGAIIQLEKFLKEENEINK
jgi:hypothetical protein